MHWLASFQHADTWVSLATLSALEIVLGIDNIIFLSILVNKLSPRRRPFARRVGLLLALGTRVGLLFALTWVMGLVVPMFTVLGRGITGRDAILIGGGLFLIGKSAHEMYEKVEGAPHDTEAGGADPAAGDSLLSLLSVLAQVALIDVVFSLDSVITAVGMARQIEVMVIAMVISVLVMLVFAGKVSDFVDKHPTVKLLALSFLLLIGVLLLAEGFGHHVPKGYIYFAMAFALGVELINMRWRKKAQAPRA